MSFSVKAKDLYNKILTRTYKDLEGGTQYGVDWPTLKALYPARANALRKIHRLMRIHSLKPRKVSNASN